VQGSAILELGSGTGLVGLVAAKVGASHIVLTDGEPAAVSLMERNIQRNGLSHICEARLLEWSHHCPSNIAESVGSIPAVLRHRVLLAADVLYASRLARWLFHAVDAHLCAEDGVLLMSHQTRYSMRMERESGEVHIDNVDEPLETFRQLAADAGYHQAELHSVDVGAGGHVPEALEGPLLVLAFSRNAHALGALARTPSGRAPVREESEWTPV